MTPKGISYGAHTSPALVRAIQAPTRHCPKCGKDVPENEFVVVHDPRIYIASSFAWQGCLACLALADSQQTPTATNAPTRALLLRAKWAITQPTDASAIDALCGDIDAALR